MDGVIEINQDRALAGGIAPGDAPGLPVTLSRAGSYRLTGNLATSGKDVTAIEVTSDDVSIDLNGFTIACSFAVAAIPQACLAATGQGDGIRVEPVSIARTTVENGSIRGMGRDGVSLGAQSRAVELSLGDNGRDGIALGSDGLATRNTVGASGRYGILAGANGGVTRNTVVGSASDGIQAGFGAAVTENAVFDSGGDGIVAGIGSTVTHNQIRDSGGDGIQVSPGSAVTRNASTYNGGSGIAAAEGSTVIGNAAGGNTSFGLSFAGTGGYRDNVLLDNNGAPGNPQVSGGLQIGANLCGPDTTCP